MIYISQIINDKPDQIVGILNGIKLFNLFTKDSYIGILVE